MSELAAFLPWGAPVSFGYLASINVAAVYLPFILAALAIAEGVAHFWTRPRAFAHHLLHGVGAVLLARYVLVPLVHIFVQTVRPYAALGFEPLIDPVFRLSFPSMHVAVLASIAFVTWKIRPSAGAALLSGAVIVGVARVLAGVHWLPDILGGLVVGAAAAAIAINWQSLFARRT